MYRKPSILTLLFILLSACATTQSPGTAGGIVKDFDAPYSSVTAATRHAVESLNVEAPAYPGAKNSFLIEDQVEDGDWLTNLLTVTAAELSARRPRKKKKK